MRDYKTELDGRLYYQLRGALTSLQYLCGDSMPPSSADTWQALAERMAAELRAAADTLDKIRGGACAFPVFFSPQELADGLAEL